MAFVLVGKPTGTPTLVAKPIRDDAFKDDGTNTWADDGDNTWVRLEDWATIAKPTGSWSMTVVEDRWSDLQRGGYATSTPGATTKIGTRGAKTAVSGGWTAVDKPAKSTPTHGGWSDDSTRGGYNEPDKRGGLKDPGDGWMTVLLTD